MKRLTSLIALLGILFWAGDRGIFKAADLFLYPLFIFSVGLIVLSLLFKDEKFEKISVLSSVISIFLYLILWILRSWLGVYAQWYILEM